MRESWSLARRELAGFFHSSIAYIFLAAFLAVSLFVVFWVDAFFARNLADIRPLFQWMPILLIFLVAAITMRMWSEERRSGTLETLLTTPVSIARLVFGKFLACFILVAIALLLTLGLPITVSLIGPLDWGPVIGGYVAALLLASTYIAVGLYVSARTENQIVSLIGTVIIGILLYLPGSQLLGAFFSTPVSHWLSLLGTGSRFDSITRGVLDLRDLYYYLSLALTFLVLNGMALAGLRWGKSRSGSKGKTLESSSGREGEVVSHKATSWLAALVIINLLVANVWLASLTSARVDLTQGKLYTLSAATHDELDNLPEPLLIEGFFSGKTHPLLAPLVPQLKSLLREYGIAGGSKVEVRFVDPQKHPGVAQKIAQRYGIKPVPFRNQSRYEASVVNAYFDVLVKYGDQYKVLGFQKLIGIEQSPSGNLKVDLKAPEYALTSAIKSVVGEYQKKGNVFASITTPVTFHGYISADSVLPEPLVKLRSDLKSTLAGLQKQADGKLKVQIEDPSANGGKLADTIAKRYGFQPMVAGLLDTTPFYFYLMLQRGDQTVPVPLPEDLSGSALEKAILTGLGQFASGMRKVVAVYAPEVSPMMARMGMDEGPKYTQLLTELRRHAVVKNTTLEKGRVPDGSQLLLVLDPENLGAKQLFAIDQFLMTGGTVVIASSPYAVSIDDQGLSAHVHKTGLADWLAAKGIHLKQDFVMDTQNATFPVPVYRNLGGVTLREYYPMPYPYFPYISGDGLSPNSPVTRSLGQVTMSWASPIMLDEKALQGDKVTRLLTTSPNTWLSTSLEIAPERDTAGNPVPWQPQGSLKPELVGVAVQGQFTSWFKDHKNPLLASAQTDEKSTDKVGGKVVDKATNRTNHKKQGDKKADKIPAKPEISGVLSHSPAASRLVVLSSASFVADDTMGMISAGLGRTYDQPIQLVQNLVDWSLESPAMLALRDKSSVSRLLEPLSHDRQIFWEYLNYGLALLGLIITAVIAWLLRKRHRARLSDWLTRQGV
jgi:ABC-2 type transport system permease protein